jgi:hypothetical protein
LSICAAAKGCSSEGAASVNAEAGLIESANIAAPASAANE